METNYTPKAVVRLVNIIQLFNSCGWNSLEYLPWGPGNDQRFYCTRPSAECNRTFGHS